MTGTECFRAALNLLSETPDSGAYYEPFALGALNQLLVNSCLLYTSQFVNGSVLEFGYCDAESDVTRYQSAEYLSLIHI